MKTTLEMLQCLVDHLNASEVDDDAVRWANSMRDMLDRHERGKLFAFTAKQKSYIAETYEKLFDEPVYENLVSAGKVPVGEIKTPVPDVLLKPLPKKPPGRKQ